jgi:hypothetical protein
MYPGREQQKEEHKPHRVTQGISSWPLVNREMQGRNAGVNWLANDKDKENYRVQPFVG